MTKTLSTLLLCFALQLLNAQTKPFVLGNIEEIQSKELSEKRVLNVYLPEGYTTNDTIRYPVIYLLDGSADEDFIHIVGLVQFDSFSWVNLLPPSIVVGIANVDRKRDLTFPTTIAKDKKDFPTTGGSEKFIAFIEKELQPFIESKYKTNASKMLIGQSLGGLLATEILFKKPALFSKYLIVSPSLWWDAESLLNVEKQYAKPGFNRNLSVYVAVGNEGRVMVNDAKKLASILKEAPAGRIQVSFESFEKENHANILHKAVYNGFEHWSKKK